MSRAKKTPASTLARILPADLFEIRSPFGRKTRIAIIVLTLALFLLGVVAAIFGEPELSYMALYSSEGTVEQIGALAILLATTFFFATYQTIRLAPADTPTVAPGRPARPIFYFLLALFAFISFGEEMSWGTRFATWLSGQPTRITEVGLGHYLRRGPNAVNIPMMYWAGSIVAYALFLPIVVGLSPRIASIFARARLPLPSRFLGIFGTLLVLYCSRLIFDPGPLVLRVEDIDELFETTLEALLLAWSMEEYAWARRATQKPVARVLATLATAMILLTLLGSIHDLSTRGWPASQSQKWLQRGIQAANRNETETAMECYQRSVDSYLGNDAAHFALGRMLDAKGRVTEAVPHFEWAVRLAPRTIEYRLALAVGYLNLWTGPSFRAAFPHLEVAIGLMTPEDPRREEALRLREMILKVKKAGDYIANNPELRARVDRWREKQESLSLPPNPDQPSPQNR